MRRIVILIAISILLLPAGQVMAKEDGLSKVLDIFSDILTKQQRLHGHVVNLRDTTVVFRADDGQTYLVDATEVAPQVRESLTLGQPITVVGRPGPKSFLLIASEIRGDERGQALRPLKKLHGVVQSANGSSVTFRTDEGRLLSVDASQIKGQQPRVTPGDPVTLVYEEGAQRKLLARWFEPDEPSTATASADITEQVRFHGYVVHFVDTALIVRADDGWTHVIDLAQLHANARKLELGEGVTITATAKDSILTATDLLRDRSDPARRGQASSKRFQTLHGTMQSMSGSTMTFRSDEGRLMPVDVSQIKGQLPKAKVNDPITLVYEPGARGKLMAMWFQPDPVQPAATVAPSPRYERLHGYVDSVDGSQFWLRTDDDRWVLVDTAQVDAATRRSVQPGRTVTVGGRLSDPTSNQFAANWIRME
jgi:hypothetical protein